MKTLRFHSVDYSVEKIKMEAYFRHEVVPYKVIDVPMRRLRSRETAGEAVWVGF